MRLRKHKLSRARSKTQKQEFNSVLYEKNKYKRKTWFISDQVCAKGIRVPSDENE